MPKSTYLIAFAIGGLLTALLLAADSIFMEPTPDSTPKIYPNFDCPEKSSAVMKVLWLPLHFSEERGPYTDIAVAKEVVTKAAEISKWADGVEDPCTRAAYKEWTAFITDKVKPAVDAEAAFASIPKPPTEPIGPGTP